MKLRSTRPTSALAPTPLRGTRPGLLRVVVGLGGLALAATSFLAMGTTAPAIAASGADGSDWGAQGTIASDSAVTLRWDNVGNPAGSVVQRNQRQIVAHSGGRNYTQIAPGVLDSYDSHFGSGNGRGGLSVTVSQTRDLVNQAVTLNVSGVDPDIANGKEDSSSYLQVMQCWGAMGADGKPDPDAADPDPTTCETGAMGPDARSDATDVARIAQADPLATGGDWATYAAGHTEVPFQAVGGEIAGNMGSNGFFSKTTTNELSHVGVSAAGTAIRQFEMQTGSESQGLGCGRRTDSPSVATCWLVLVPRIDGVMMGNGPISPSLWAQRLQVRLGFQDVVTTCPGGRARTLTGGSELLVRAAASWIPGACDAAKLTLGYTSLGDQVARTQYVAGSNDAILTSQSLAAGAQAAYVPLALAAPVIGLLIDYVPSCTTASDLAIEKVTTEAGAVACGYANLAELTTDLAKAGQPIRDLRLNARLVAKLLTQTYAKSMQSVPSGFGSRPKTILDDPEFQRLNPQLVHARISGDDNLQREAATLLVESMRSDAAAQVWAWLLADSAAASFLSGCPDDDGLTINPFYSSRTYTGCREQAPALTQQAAAARASTDTPDAYFDQAVDYPPDGSPYPLPEWLYSTRAGGGEHAQGQADWLPRENDMSLTGRSTFNGGKSANRFCATSEDPLTCVPAPGKWVASAGRTPIGKRSALAITDAATAARYQLPTASLCDSAGKHCVAATSASLRAAATQFEEGTVDGVLEPGAADYADGAYPLTLPVYAAVRPTLTQTERNAYADAFTYIVGAGQEPGFTAGDLPPGYAPLTKALVARAKAGIAGLRAGVAAPSGSPSATGTATAGATAAPSSAAGSAADPGTVALPDPGAVDSAAAAPGTGVVAVTPGALVPASASTERWPAYTLPLGLAIALWCGAAGPLMRIRTRLRVSR